ncbi:MAG: hypothetical protein A2571_00605 [Candidatus Vogelbacteria bacterium RIFOXYD1_FULL_44_32]|uniref:Uncharacterized protein n=1 Tax=Candidatus Vogelbacteria bacterium RIFOXYD1_FULL_44_32 TaxID=1802438 RepID=A0A1G2QFN5_9BACT|nr:MAG: hypothetical protein A2571_00605 [Candidatus Vogelbacteria bacterium RIFOXYD1_FULL_44_32]
MTKLERTLLRKGVLVLMQCWEDKIMAPGFVSWDIKQARKLFACTIFQASCSCLGILARALESPRMAGSCVVLIIMCALWVYLTTKTFHQEFPEADSIRNIRKAHGYSQFSSALTWFLKDKQSLELQLGFNTGTLSDNSLNLLKSGATERMVILAYAVLVAQDKSGVGSPEALGRMDFLRESQKILLRFNLIGEDWTPYFDTAKERYGREKKSATT